MQADNADQLAGKEGKGQLDATLQAEPSSGDVSATPGSADTGASDAFGRDEAGAEPDSVEGSSGVEGPVTKDSGEAKEENKAPPPPPKDFAGAGEAKARGNKLFKSGDFAGALESYERAVLLCPEDQAESLAAFHCNSAACYMRLEQWDDCVKSCGEAIKLNPKYVKAFVRRSAAYEKLDKPVEAFEDMKKASELAPQTARLQVNAARLSAEAKERQEKMKNEMLGKLKDLGNMFLGNFGMSLDNFKTVKDPSTGNYSISFKQ